MNSFDCLDRETKVFGPHLLEASAGTGKTFAIEHLVVRFLLENPLLTIDQILVVTFTRAATRELKQRIYQNINKVLNQLEQKEPCSLDYLFPYQKDLEAKKRLQEALFCFDQAQIFTIHGFCHKMLSENFISSLAGVTNGLSTKKLKKKVVYDFFRSKISSERFHFYQLDLIVKKFQGIENLVDRLIYLFPEKPKLKPTFSDLVNQFSEVIKNDHQEIDEEAIIDNFEKIAPSYKKTGFTDFDTFYFQIQQIVDVVKNKKANGEDFGTLLQQGLTVFEFLDTDNQKKTAKLGDVSPFFTWVKKTIYPLVKEALDSTSIISNLCNDLFPFLEKELEEKNLLTPDQILQKMLIACQKNSFIQKIKNRYQVIIIDEFQDTDPIQWSIFEKLNTDLKAFYLVGDPKQSIYRFRKADLYTYLQAQTQLGNSSIYHLRTNFRSSKELVSSLNALFSKEFASDWLYLPKFKSYLSYLSVEAGSNALNLKDEKAPLHFFIAEEKGQKSSPSKELERKKFFPYIANEILTLKEQNKETLSFAVLVKDRYQAQRLQHFLNSEKIPSIANTSSDIRTTLSFYSLEKMLKAVIFSPDLNFIKQTLIGPFINLDEQEIKTIEKKQWFTPVLNIFYSLKQTLFKKGLSPFFSQLLSTDFLGDKITVLERLCQKDLSFYHDTMQVIELLVTISSQRIYAFDELLTLFPLLQQMELDEASLKRGQVQKDEAVQIITTHMSKGLEYDVVFALGLASSSPLDSLLTEEEIEEIDAEKLRQLYVALTRGKKRIYIPFVIDSGNQPLVKGRASAIHLFFSRVSKNEIDKKTLIEQIEKLQEKGTYTLLEEEIFSLKVKEKKTEEISLFPAKKIHLEFPHSSVYTFSQLASNSSLEHLQVNKEDLPIGAGTGVVLHTLLEKVICQKAKREEKPLFEFIKKEVLKTPLVGFESQIFEMIQRVLFIKMPHSDGSFYIDEIPVENIQTEMEFLYPLVDLKNQNSFFKGVIDLCFYFKGKYYLIDWKSNYLGNKPFDYEDEQLKKNMIEHQYDLQASIYIEGFRRYIENVEKKSFSTCFGGMFYVYLRGLIYQKGIYQIDHSDTKDFFNELQPSI